MGQGRFFLLLLLVVASTAVPISKQQRRIKRDNQNSSTNGTISKNVCVLDEHTYENGQEVPSLGPCEKCICEAPDVICSMIKCQPNSGCRILQQSGQCCPEYKCDCEYNGVVYNNGERLDKPEDPCQVCYCKGGEIMCTSITCYERDDCQPHYTAGQCCPKYDHCPVETSRASGNSVRSVNTSLYSPKREMQPWPLTKPNTLTSVSYEESSTSPSVYPRTIRIVEILPTTPGSESKPSEVSVIPRIKTNDHSTSEDISKEVSSTASSLEYSSSTSEVEHLLETTTETTREVKNESTTPENNFSSSTLNPLAESVDLNTLSDSYRMSTVYPDYYHTEGNLNYVEEGTTNFWNETEGSGYELLKGGIYEETSTVTSLLTSDGETVTESLPTTANLPSDVITHEDKNEKLQSDKISDLPTFEAYTATEPSRTSENLSYRMGQNITEWDDENSTSSSTLESVSESEDSGSDESLSSYSGSVEYINESSNTTDTTENQNNQTSTFESSTDISENQNNETSTSESTTEQYSSQALLKNENLIAKNRQSEDFSTTDELLTSTIETTVSDVYDETSTLENKSEVSENESDVTTGNNELNTTAQYSEGSTEPSEIYLISQTPDENKAETKRAVVGNYRNLDSDLPEIDEYHYPSRDETENYSGMKTDNTFTTPSLISIPPVLNVNSLNNGEISPQLENKTSHNASSMAKVGIYHPTKPEFASFVTVVDDKANVSSNENGSGSPHILLTPNDLKKLAEILIHQKIKPIHLNRTADKNKSEDTSSPKINTSTETYRTASVYDNDTSSTTKEKNMKSSELLDNVGQNVTGSHDNFNRALGNQGTSTTNISTVDVDLNDASAVTESSNTATSFKDIRNFVSTVPNDEESPKDIVINDPNTSRQIRIKNSNQYSTLLDDRDLAILENFFKKNIGLH